MSVNDKTKKMFWNVCVLLIFLIGVGICWNSISKMNYDCSTHDLGSLPSKGEQPNQLEGHLGYIAYLHQYHKLPQTDPRLQGSFYNPPLFYLSEAMLWGMMEKVGSSDIQIHEAFQWIPFFCTIVSMAVMLLLLRKMGMKGFPFVLMEILICFHPAFSILSLTVNPDAMAFLFVMLVILLTWRWYEKPGFLRIGLLGLAFGLGMLTKLSDALMAPAVAVVFCVVLLSGKVKAHQSISRVSILMQYVLFLIISVPIGMFWYIRNIIRFGMPMNYVPSVSDIGYLCISQNNLGFIKRLGLPSPSTLKDIHFVISAEHQYNIWAQTFKTAIVDEKYLTCNTEFTGLLLHMILIVSLILAIILNIMFLWVMLRNHRISRLQKAFLLLVYGVILGNYINFCFAYPQTCTMSYRYIPVTLLFPCIGGGLIWEDLNKKWWGKIVQIGLTALILFFSAGSVWLYLTQLHQIS